MVRCLLADARGLGSAGSIGAHAQKLEDPFEIPVVEEADFEGAFALVIAEANLGPEALAEPGLEGGEVDIAGTGPGPGGAGGGGGVGLLEAGDQFFGLSDIQAVPEDAVAGQALLLGSGQGEEDLGVAYGEAALPEMPENFLGKAQEPEGVGDGDAAFADAGGDIFLAEVELVDQLLVALGFLDGVEVLPLEILDQREFERGGVVGFADEDGDLGEAGELGGAPAAFAGNQLERIAATPDDEGLDDALFPDRVSQLLEGVPGKVLAGLQGAGTEPAERHALDAFRAGGGRFGGEAGGLRSGGGRGGSGRRRRPQQRPQAAT